MKRATRTDTVVLLLAALNVALHIAFYNTLGFHRDELLYFSLGQHPAAGYASVPPFTGIMAWIMIQIAGSSLFSARILPALMSGVLVWVVSLIVKEMKGGNYARVLASAGVIVTPINLRGFSLFQPVFFDVLFWTLIFWSVLRLINTGRDKYLILLGVITGFAFLNKYLVLLQLTALLAMFTLSDRRQIFRRRAFYLALLLTIFIALPNLVWQFLHDLPVLTHMKALNDSQLVNVDRLTFLTDQVFIAFMGSLLTIPGLIFLFSVKEMSPYRILGFTCLIVLAALLLLRGKSYYSAGLIPFLAAAGAVAWEHWLKRLLPRAILLLTLVLVTLPALPMGIPVFRKVKLAEYFAFVRDRIGFDAPLRDEDGQYHALPQDYADMLGWDELAAAAGSAWQSIPDPSSCFVFCNNYGQAGALTVLGKQYGLPQPVCFSESFYYWIPKILPVEITSAIYVNDQLGEDIADIFTDIAVAGEVTDTLAREYGTKVYLCTRPRKSFNRFWMEIWPQVKTPFD